MLSDKNFTAEHILDLQRSSRKDPALLERAVYAFGLLEALVRVGLPFVFKGGTCLVLLFERPYRLSTDIDIVVEPDTDIAKYVALASRIFPFLCYEEQTRIGRNKVVKRHFKFYYDSPTSARRFNILLDVLFEANHYECLVQREIKNALLLVEGSPVTVTVPSPECILGDKLTAFAPHTTGIPLNIGKDMEVMKQLFVSFA